MKTFLAIASLAFLAVVLANPTNSNTITYEDSDGNIVTENLDDPSPVTYAVDINKLRFMLYTPTNKDTPQELKNGDVTRLKNSGFSADRPTVMVLHGWQNNYETESVQMIKNSYLASENVNILCADWKEYNSPYLSAISSAKKVGENMGIFVEFLISQGLKVKDLHIIGHSLGAHIGSFAANTITSKTNTKVPRITGLDPAGPMFNGKGADGRLSSDDADHVDCIHTSTAFGMTNRCGTHDFYPNGGENQPTCVQASMSDGCDHASSYRYWSQSIANKHAFPARACKSESEAQSDYAPSVCAAGTGYMGVIANQQTAPGVYYVAI